MILKTAVDHRDLAQSRASKSSTEKTRRTVQVRLRFSVELLPFSILQHLIGSNCGF